MIPTSIVLTWLFIHIGVILVVTAYYTMSAALAPNLTDRARQRFAKRPWLPLLIGVVVSVPWVVLSLVLLNADAGGVKFSGAVLGCLWILCGLMGGAGIAQHIGRSRSMIEHPSWSDTFRGGLFIALTWVLPLVGWLGMLPMTLAGGVGCLMLGIIPMRDQNHAQPVLVPPVVAS